MQVSDLHAKVIDSFKPAAKASQSQTSTNISYETQWQALTVSSPTVKTSHVHGKLTLQQFEGLRAKLYGLSMNG